MTLGRVLWNKWMFSLLKGAHDAKKIFPQLVCEIIPFNLSNKFYKKKSMSILVEFWLKKHLKCVKIVPKLDFLQYCSDFFRCWIYSFFGTLLGSVRFRIRFFPRKPNIRAIKNLKQFLLSTEASESCIHKQESVMRSNK